MTDLRWTRDRQALAAAAPPGSAPDGPLAQWASIQRDLLDANPATSA